MNQNRADRGGYTLVEILVATALTLMVLAAVVQVFGTVSESISDARSFVEKVDQLRTTQRQLKQDLGGVTAYMTPPLAPEQGLGYFEYVEGPLGPVLPLGDPNNPQAVNVDHANEMDSTQGDTDDVLMFTTRSRTIPFAGRAISWGKYSTGWAGYIGAIQSQLAEVSWFVRGRTLYRRVLLITPQLMFYPPIPGDALGRFTPTAAFYNANDVSARYDPAQGKMVANTLADLTRPENRFAHANGFASSGIPPSPNPSPATPPYLYFLYPPHPHNVTSWLGPNYSVPWPPGAASTTNWFTGLKLPTLCELTNAAWDASYPLPTPTLTPTNVFDAWRNPHPFNQQDTVTGNLTAYYNANRVSEDVILTNVIGFDVKVWDPQAPIIQTTSGVVLLPGDPGYIKWLEYNEHAGNYPVGSGAYVDLNYLYPYRKDNQNGVTGAVIPPATFTPSIFSGYGQLAPSLNGSGLYGSDPGFDADKSHTTPLCSVYDTWCTRFANYYWRDSTHSNNATQLVDNSSDGFDDGNIGVVDAANKKVIFPPYPTTLRGIQVKIRVYEPDSRQVREVTVTQSFLNE